jgi:hypothetical protein
VGYFLVEGGILFGNSTDNNDASISYGHNTQAMSFATADAERMRIDSSGNVLINSGVYLSWGTNGASSIEGSTVSNKLQKYKSRLFFRCI